MNKTKKKGVLMVACLMLVVTMLATCIVSGTLAIFYSDGTVSGLSLTVAPWKITVAGDEIPTTSSIDLSGLSWTITPDDGVAEPSTGTIAPGTWGYVPIEIDNQGEVDVIVKVIGFDSVTPSDVPSSLNFYIISSDSEPDSYPNENDSNLTGDGITVGKGDNITLYICFHWSFEGSDTGDTEFGKEMAESADNTIKFGTMTIEVTQAATSD